MSPNYHDHTVEIPKSAFPWCAGHRLKKSHKFDLTYSDAQKYYESIAHCKTRFIYQEIPLSFKVSRAFGARSKELRQAVMDINPLYSLFKKQNSLKSNFAGKVINKALDFSS